MLIGMELNEMEINEIFTIIYDSSPEFYLTGNRFFDIHDSSSNYDFFVQNSELTRRFLGNYGFRHLYIPVESCCCHHYYDKNTLSAMRFMKKDIVIDVQLVKDAKLKNDIQNLIKEQYLVQYRSMEKWERRELWNLLYMVYDNGRSDMSQLKNIEYKPGPNFIWF